MSESVCDIVCVYVVVSSTYVCTATLPSTTPFTTYTHKKNIPPPPLLPSNGFIAASVWGFFLLSCVLYRYTYIYNVCLMTLPRCVSWCIAIYIYIYIYILYMYRSYSWPT